MSLDLLIRDLERGKPEIILPRGRRYGHRMSCARCGTMLYPRNVVWYPEDQDLAKGLVPKPYCRRSKEDPEGGPCSRLEFQNEFWEQYTRDKMTAMVERMAREGWSQRDIDAKAHYYKLEKRRILY